MRTQTITQNYVKVKFVVSERECRQFITEYNKEFGCSWDVRYTNELVFNKPHDRYIDFLCRLERAGVSEFRVIKK
jgi:hypothetical protein